MAHLLILVKAPPYPCLENGRDEEWDSLCKGKIKPGSQLQQKGGMEMRTDPHLKPPKSTRACLFCLQALGYQAEFFQGGAPTVLPRSQNACPCELSHSYTGHRWKMQRKVCPKWGKEEEKMMSWLERGVQRGTRVLHVKCCSVSSDSPVPAGKLHESSHSV